jgi:hypothetical protein
VAGGRELRSQKSPSPLSGHSVVSRNWQAHKATSNGIGNFDVDLQLFDSRKGWSHRMIEFAFKYGRWLVLLLVALALIFILPSVALFKAMQAQRDVARLKARLRALEDHRFNAVSAEQTAPAPFVSPPAPIPPETIFAPPPLPVRPEIPVSVITPPPPSRPPINWEQFMGAKMFAWIGGLALFLASPCSSNIPSNTI